MKQKLSKEIFEMKYMINGEKKVDDVISGVAKEISMAETQTSKQKQFEKEFYDAISQGYLLPAGRILANARVDSKIKNYSNCFTIELSDSIEAIYDALKDDAKISKVGGGVGFDASPLRPKGAPLSCGGEASGVISFLEVFDASAKIIMTGGQRRSAHIALLDVSHPDIEEFITCKHGDENKVLTQFNISVKISDAFMEAVSKDANWNLVFDGKTYKTIKAKYLFDLIVANNFKYAEPGLFFTDTVSSYNNTYWIEETDPSCVNPCGEITMSPYSSCILSSLNLSKFVNKPFTDTASIDYYMLSKTARLGIRFLDNVIEQQEYPLEKIKEQEFLYRRIGLGFTGLGALLCKMKVKYGSEEGNEIVRKVMETIRNSAYEASSDLAVEKGSFTGFDADKYLEAKFVKKLPESIREKIRTQGIRNAHMLTVAPTGTTSLALGNNCSSGIEPIFALQYDRRVRSGRGEDTFTETVYDDAWLSYQEIIGETKTEDKPEWFSTCAELTVDDHVNVQAIVQEYVDHSISKTVNLPSGSGEDLIRDTYFNAWKKGLKGCTVFHPDGFLAPVISVKKEETPAERKESIVTSKAPKRPLTLPCDCTVVKIDGEEYLAVVGLLNGQPYEIFVAPVDEMEHCFDVNDQFTTTKLGKGLYALYDSKDILIAQNLVESFSPDIATICRMTSGQLRHGVPVEFIRDQLGKMNLIGSIPQVLSRVLKQYEEEDLIKVIKCPECESTNVKKQDGCPTCPDCGWSKCG